MAKQKSEQPAPTAPHVEISKIPEHHVRLFKGATRIATIKGGVPTRAFVIMMVSVGTVAMFSLKLLLLIPILYPIMAIISRQDDRAFRIWELWIRTKAFARNKRYWNAISFTPTPYHRRRAWCRKMDE